MQRHSKDRSLSYDNETFVGDMASRDPPPGEHKFATIDRKSVRPEHRPRPRQKPGHHDRNSQEPGHYPRSSGHHPNGQEPGHYPRSSGHHPRNGQDPRHYPRSSGHHPRNGQDRGSFPNTGLNLGYNPGSETGPKPGPHPHYNPRVSSLSRSSATSHGLEDKQSFAEALSKQQLKREEQESIENSRRWMSVWRSESVLIVSYFLGTVCFIVFFHLQSLPKLPFPIGHNLADWDENLIPYIWWPKGTVLIELMWGFTHIRKTFMIVAAAATLAQGSTHKHLPESHDTRSGQRASLGILVLGYHLVFGTWLGWANNPFSGYYLTDMQYVLPGISMYAIGEITVTAGTMYFIRKKTPENELFRRFRLASDFFIWTGFAIVSWTLPALIIFFLRFLFLAYFLCVPHRPAWCCS